MRFNVCFLCFLTIEYFSVHYLISFIVPFPFLLLLFLGSTSHCSLSSSNGGAEPWSLCRSLRRCGVVWREAAALCRSLTTSVVRTRSRRVWSEQKEMLQSCVLLVGWTELLKTSTTPMIHHDSMFRLLKRKSKPFKNRSSFCCPLAESVVAAGRNWLRDTEGCDSRSSEVSDHLCC